MYSLKNCSVISGSGGLSLPRWSGWCGRLWSHHTDHGWWWKHHPKDPTECHLFQDLPERWASKILWVLRVCGAVIVVRTLSGCLQTTTSPKRDWTPAPIVKYPRVYIYWVPKTQVPYLRHTSEMKRPPCEGCCLPMSHSYCEDFVAL